MDAHERLLGRILDGTSDANIRFRKLCALLRHYGFVERTRGSHHIFSRPGLPEMINLQRDGSKAKPYQINQVRGIFLEYGIATENEGAD